MALASVLVLHALGVPAPPPLSRNVDCSYGGASFGAFLVSLLRVWLESGIPPTLSVVGVRSAVSSAPVLRSGRNTCTAGAAAYQRVTMSMTTAPAKDLRKADDG